MPIWSMDRERRKKERLEENWENIFERKILHCSRQSHTHIDVADAMRQKLHFVTTQLLHI